jgi:hypothetical protein
VGPTSRNGPQGRLGRRDGGYVTRQLMDVYCAAAFVLGHASWRVDAAADEPQGRRVHARVALLITDPCDSLIGSTTQDVSRTQPPVVRASDISHPAERSAGHAPP